MQPSVADAAALLSRTPGTLRELLRSIGEPLATGNEGGKALDALLETFAEVRAESVQRLLDLGLTEGDFARTGTHPTFGRVTLAQQLTTWVVHDLCHLAQIARVMAKMKTEIGPSTAFIPIVTTRA